jgi:hypothetical protein
MGNTGEYDLLDDLGVWVVWYFGPGEARFDSEEAAQDECNRRNHAAGIANEDGELKSELTEGDLVLWRSLHLEDPECTCKIGSGS